MQKITATDFRSYYSYNAIFFSEDNIVVCPQKNTPFVNFKDGLDLFSDQIKEVFLEDKLLFVDLDKQDKGIYPAKAFLRNSLEESMPPILRGMQYLTWNRKSAFCSQCGRAIKLAAGGASKKCEACDLSFFPSLSPAIMVLPRRGDEILLARSPHFNKGVYSALAGFVDLGESAECAVHREVQEEVGLKVKSLQYFGSQSWPFPNSFMIAFTAEYLSGEITIDPNEIEDAKWFSLRNLPDLPYKPSISRKLIDSVLLGACKKPP